MTHHRPRRAGDEAFARGRMIPGARRAQLAAPLHAGRRGRGDRAVAARLAAGLSANRLRRAARLVARALARRAGAGLHRSRWRWPARRWRASSPWTRAPAYLDQLVVAPEAWGSGAAAALDRRRQARVAVRPRPARQPRQRPRHPVLREARLRRQRRGDQSALRRAGLQDELAIVITRAVAIRAFARVLANGDRRERRSVCRRILRAGGKSSRS